MNRKTTLSICFAAFLIFMITSGHIGISMHSRGDEYLFTAATNLFLLLLSPVFIAFLVRYKPKGRRVISGDIVPLMSRFGALMIDFISALLPASAILAFPAILIEWHYTGNLEWHFSRDFFRATDIVIIPTSILPTLVWLLFYFSYPLTKGSQTIGQYIMGFRIAQAGKNQVAMRTAVSRTILSFFVLCIGWISVPLAYFDKQKHLLHDKNDGLRPEQVTYINS